MDNKRQSLRELQNRLAEKLQAVRSGDVAFAASWLAIEAAGEKYLFPLSQSGEIFSLTAIQKIAHTRNWYVGVANLRGALFGIADFASFVHQKAPLMDYYTQNSEARFITLNASLEMNCALYVDRIDGLRSSESFRESSKAAPNAPTYFGHVYTDVNGLHWQEINLQLLSQQPDFLNVHIV